MRNQDDVKSVQGSVNSGRSSRSGGRLWSIPEGLKSSRHLSSAAGPRSVVSANRNHSLNADDETVLNFRSQGHEITLPKKSYCSGRFPKVLVTAVVVSALLGGIAGMVVSRVKPSALAWTSLKHQWENDLAAAAVGFAISAISVLLLRAFWWSCCNKPEKVIDRSSLNQPFLPRRIERAGSGVSLPSMAVGEEKTEELPRKMASFFRQPSNRTQVTASTQRSIRMSFRGKVPTGQIQAGLAPPV